MILFENEGTLDVRAVKTMGLSSKDKGRTTIGFFGTGLKYAIAVLLRTGHKLWLHDGLGHQYEFNVVRAKVRFDTFDFVTINGEDLGITTDLGKNWEPWMAYRELYCNALDEGGHTKAVGTGTFDGKDLGKVRVLVEGPLIETIHRDRFNYILDTRRDWKYNELGVEVYPRQKRGGRGSIFYKGIRISTTPEEARYDYNIRNQLDLTEDRTLKYFHQVFSTIGTALMQGCSKDMIEDLMYSESALSFEGRLTLSYSYETPSTLFLDTIGDMRKKYKDDGVNPSAIVVHEKHRAESIMPKKSVKLTGIQTKQLDRAKTFCKNILGLEIESFPLIICDNLGDSRRLGLADMNNDVMYLALNIFGKGTKYLVMGLIEEFTHLEHRVGDETLEQKQIYLEMIASLGEQLHGEPL